MDSFDQKKSYTIKAINKPWENLIAIHIDTLTQECGAFDASSDLNNGYGCKANAESDHPGCCYTFSCPIAVELDQECPQWEDEYSEGEWMLQHSFFEGHDSQCDD